MLKSFLVVICVLMMSDFIFRGLLIARQPSKTDFTELYTSAWLWRHGQNFYDSALVTATSSRLTGSGILIAPVYPPTTLVAIAPLTFLPWGWANLIWLSLLLGGIGATIVLLMRLARFKAGETEALYLWTFVLAFDPVHQAFHLGNIALLVVPLCLVGIVLAERRSDLAAGTMLALATLLKPQLAVWCLLFYLLQRRKWIFAGAVAATVLLTIPLLWSRVSIQSVLFSYRANLKHWFGMAGPYGFTERALPFHVNTIQVVLFQICHSNAVNLIAYLLFLIGLSVWALAVFKNNFRVSVPLAASSLTALSFVASYHSVSDTVILTLALCWIFGAIQASQDWTPRAALVIILLMLMPGHSALMRITPYLSRSIVETWFWKLFIARYFIWLVLAFNATLLLGLWRVSSRRFSKELTI